MNRRTSARPEFEPAQHRAQLAAGAAALGVVLDAGQIEQLLDFGRLLLRWNAIHNLTAIESPGEVVTHHLLDSLALVPCVLRAGGRRVLDVGSGGGLPGIPLAIALPDRQLTLVDAVQKKCAFLTQVALELGLRNVAVRHARVETLAGSYDLIVARAFAAAADLVRLTAGLLAPDGCWLAMKGRRDPAAAAGLPATVQVVRDIPLEVPGLGEARHVLEIRFR